MEHINLTSQFLIAMPYLKDSNFFQTVTYIFSHSNQGAMGIVINKPLDLLLDEILEQMNIPSKNEQIKHQPVYEGGPIQTEQGFILHRSEKKWQSTVEVEPEIYITTSKDILTDIAKGNGPNQALIVLGYASWDAGQLEQELVNNVWLCAPSDTEIIFDTPYKERWKKAVGSIGIDLKKLSPYIGHT